jgi:hypothetical protein
MNRTFILLMLLILSMVIPFSCSKEKTEKGAGDIQIQSLSCTINPIEAWDTTFITMEAIGSNLQYGWEANHGSITGSGKMVKYAAGECCVGLNTIACRVFNDTGEASDTVMIRVTTHYHPK